MKSFSTRIRRIALSGASVLILTLGGAGATLAEVKPAEDAEADAEAGTTSEPPAAQEPLTSPPDDDARPVVSSKEQGQSRLEEAFDWYRSREEIRAQRKRALSETQFELLVRNFYLDRHKYDDTRSQAWAIGGGLGLKTGYFRERVALGVTGYTTQRLIGDDDKDGTLLLKPDQRGFSVLGELYADVWVFDGLNLYAGRKTFDTPYINKNDVRMIPNSFEAVTAQGRLPVGDKASVNYGVGYFHSIKERDSDEFVTMSQDAGADEDRGVYTAGARFTLDDFTIGAIDYFSEDIINIAYAEASNTFDLPAELRFKLSLQYSDQQSTGKDLLDDEGFSAQQYGIKGDLAVGPALFSVAFTQADGSANMRSPWSGYPGFTSVQVEDFNRDGETAVMLRAGTEIPYVPGLSAYALWVHGDPPDDSTQFRRDEVDFNVQWAPAEGTLKGFSARVRYAVVDQHDSSVENLHDVRVILNYDFKFNVRI